MTTLKSLALSLPQVFCIGRVLVNSVSIGRGAPIGKTFSGIGCVLVRPLGEAHCIAIMQLFLVRNDDH